MIRTACLLAALASPGCVPVAERQIERGCYILVADPLGELPARPLHWHIDAYPSRAAAEAGREPRGTVVEALGRVWLMSIAEAGYRARGGEHGAEIGPLPTTAGMSAPASYSSLPTVQGRGIARKHELSAAGAGTIRLVLATS